MFTSSGYFEAHLYGTVGLSIHPDRQHIISPEMLSWFPLFFPFKVRSKSEGKGILMRSSDASALPILLAKFPHLVPSDC